MRSWKDYVIRWRKQYPPPKVPYDPSKVRASPLRCEKCKSQWKVTRHHKGHEFYLAVIDEEAYAARYIQFRPEDIVPLCARCHERIHKLYSLIMMELRLYVNDCLSHVEADGTPIWNHKPSRLVLESFRKRMISRCNRWLKNKIRKPKGSRKRKITQKSKTQNENTKFQRIKKL